MQNTKKEKRDRSNEFATHYDYTNTMAVFEDPEKLDEILTKALAKYPQVYSLEEFPNPYQMKDMDNAIKLFTEAVANNEKIKFIIDSDMDGLGCYTIWYHFFQYFPYRNIELLITDRKKGYGFIPEYVDEESRLYITSDNGITSVEATKKAKEKDAKVIICDHHQPDLEVGLPPADAIIDPYQPGDEFPYKDISGTFVLWFFIKALIEKYQLNIDPYEEFLPEIALTTLSDVMPINKHLNRYVVKDFIDRFCSNESCHREYLNTFREYVSDQPTAETFSFNLVPMVNATQRMTTAAHGAMFLIAQEKNSSKQWFEYLQGLNNARKERQQTLLSYIEKYYKDYIKQPFIVIPGNFQKDYKGVLGIIAGRLAEKHHKPCIVLNYNKEEDAYSGSGRSIGDLDILEVLRDNPFVENVGGHRQALGITVKKEKFNDFFTKLQEDIQKVPEEILKPKKLPLGFIPINKLNIDFYNELKKFEPFGHQFQKPTFTTRGIIKSARLVGKQKNHLSVVITDKKGLVQFNGMKFFTTEVPERGKEYMIYFKIDTDSYRGSDKIQLQIQDLIPIQEG